MKTAIVIKSFRKHFPQTYILLESITKFNQDDLPVYIIIPEREQKLFVRPSQKNLEIIFEEDLILEKYSKRYTYKDNFMYARIRNWRGTDSVFGRKCYRGNLVQQLCKMALPIHLNGEIENFIILDSDIVFIRPFKESDFVKNNHSELICVPAKLEPGSLMDMWIVDAKRFLGLSATSESINWVALGTCWYYEAVRLLVEYVQNRHQRHWQEALMKHPFETKFQDHPFFSEMQLYGVFHKYLSSVKHREVKQPKVYNLWIRKDLEHFFHSSEDDLRRILRPYILFGLQKEMVSHKLRRRTVEKLQKIVTPTLI